MEILSLWVFFMCFTWLHHEGAFILGRDDLIVCCHAIARAQKVAVLHVARLKEEFVMDTAGNVCACLFVSLCRIYCMCFNLYNNI